MRRLSGTVGRLGREIYPGWPIAVALGFTEMISWGILYYAFSVMLAPMQAELGWSRTQLTAAFSLAFLTSGLAAVPVGAWIDRRGARLLMTVGSCLTAVLVLVWSAVDSLPVFFVLWALMGVGWAMVLYEPAFAVIAQWFRRGRARALTVVTGLAAFASTLFFPLTTWLVTVQGWRAALLTLALLLALVTVPIHALVLRGRPEDLGLAVDGKPVDPAVATPIDVATRDALKGGVFWWLALAFALEALITVGLGVHLIPYLLDVGHGAGVAAAVAGLVGAMKFPSRLLFGPLADRFSVQGLTTILFGFYVAALALLASTPTIVGAITFAVLYGAAQGAVTTARPALIASLYGRANYGTIAGAMSASGLLARTAAPVGIGLLYDALGTYRPELWGLAALSGLAMLAVLAAANRQARHVAAS